MPDHRSGTTFLQRLITSSDNGICYGEFTGRRIAELCDFAHKELLLIQKNEDRQAVEWKNVFSGDVDYWMAGLDLPGDFSKHALLGAVQFYRQHHDEATRLVNKEIWAVKFPKLEFTRVVRIADLINDLKCIYIYRNVFDVIRSQKSKGWISNRQIVIESCLEWVKNTDVIAALKKNDFRNQPAMLHVVQYEDLVRNLDSNLKAIEAFSGLRGIKPAVADTKVNTWITASGEDMTPAVSYREPEPLTEEEAGTIATICGSRMDELYPGFETPAP
ncbi:sulfotransferase [Roseibium sp.]|uniref:sulfotransferase n=1 Tax=Roseibium sp. TaxID=1936156 RepID=UPI003267D3EC